MTKQPAISENLQYTSAPASKNRKRNIWGMEAWNKAFAISDYRTKAILKICSAVTAWTRVNKEHRTGSTSNVRSMLKHTGMYSPLPARFPFAFCLLWKNRASYETFS